MGNVPNLMFWECFKGLTKVTKENCCYGYPLRKTKSKMIIFENVMPFVLVKTGMEYLKYIQSYKILFNVLIFWLN